MYIKLTEQIVKMSG